MIFVDHRGFVPSSKPIDPTAYTLDTIVEDIEAIIKHLNVGKMVIIGHSGHGYMAQAYAKKYPQHVSHLVMIATGPKQSLESHQAAEQYLQDSVCPERKAQLAKDLENLPEELAKYPDKRFITFCLKLGARSWFDYTFKATPLWQDVYVNMPIIDHFWGTIFRDIDVTKDIKKLTMPTLIALGRYDYLVAPPYTWNTIRPQFPNLTVRIFERSSHTPQYEQSHEFNRELLLWLAENESA
jgi:proline iminopeptidase